MSPHSRRQFLRGAFGAIVALPMLRTFARAATVPPKRFVFLYHPNGVDAPTFTPSVQSEDVFTLGPSHTSLEGLREHVLWASGLDLAVAVEGPGEQHQRGLGALLTGQKIGAGDFKGNDGTRAGWAQGISLDQTIARLVGQSTPVGSLQLGVNVRERDVSGVISYSGAGQPLVPQNDPRQTYRSLFFTLGASREAAELTLKRRQSVLDTVNAQLSEMRRMVAREDQLRLDEHASIVRDLEMRLSALPPLMENPPAAPPSGSPHTYEGCAASGEPPALNPETVEAMEESARLQIELMALALRCDLTRVATLCVSDAKNHISLPFLGIAGDVHNISHYSDQDERHKALAVRDRWMSDLFARIVTKLLEARELDGSRALDHSLVLWGSEVSRGNTHSHSDMPFIAAGHALGWRMNRAVHFANRPHNELLLSIARGFGGTMSSYGDARFCSSELTQLF